MFKNLLPIGSVVLLKEGTKKLMITGIKPVSEDNPETVFDYIGVVYPEGYLSNEYNFLFNHDDINDIVFTGYNNPERENFIEYMEEEYNKAQRAEDTE